LLFSKTALLILRSEVDALATHRGSVAVWLILARRRTPGGIGVPALRQILWG
jgi:hypothetical protein